MLRFGCEGTTRFDGSSKIYTPIFDQPDPKKDARIIAYCEHKEDAERICIALNRDSK